MPEIANVFRRAGVDFHQVTGMLDDDPVCWNEVDAWIEAARVANVMFHNRLGLMGHYYCGMLDIYSDLTQQCAYFGGHIEMVEVDELRGAPARRQPKQIQTGSRRLRTCSTCNRTARPAELGARRGRRWRSTGSSRSTISARSPTTTWAPARPANEDAISSIILGNSLLTARGVPVAGEYEVKNVQAMKILDTFGAGGSFTEYYAMDLPTNRADGPRGPGHIAIAKGKTKVRPLKVYHGKVGRGLSVEMSVKHGRSRCCRSSRPATGDSGCWSPKANRSPARSWKSATPTAATVSHRRPAVRHRVEQHGPAHHCAVGTGHVSDRLAKLGKLLRIDVAHVC